jgi:hypothetical protein
MHGNFRQYNIHSFYVSAFQMKIKCFNLEAIRYDFQDC